MSKITKNSTSKNTESMGKVKVLHGTPIIYDAKKHNPKPNPNQGTLKVRCEMLTPGRYAKRCKTIESVTVIKGSAAIVQEGKITQLKEAYEKIHIEELRKRIGMGVTLRYRRDEDGKDYIYVVRDGDNIIPFNESEHKIEDREELEIKRYPAIFKAQAPRKPRSLDTSIQPKTKDRMKSDSEQDPTKFREPVRSTQSVLIDYMHIMRQEGDGHNRSGHARPTLADIFPVRAQLKEVKKQHPIDEEAIQRLNGRFGQK